MHLNVMDGERTDEINTSPGSQSDLVDDSKSNRDSGAGHERESSKTSAGSDGGNVDISHSASSSLSSSPKNKGQDAETRSPNPVTISPVESPPMQVMERSSGYDPNRIPSSVFRRNKSGTPMEWSVASNESLFSIHVGNSSFSMDPSFNYGELFKSGELMGYSSNLALPSPPAASPSPPSLPAASASRSPPPPAASSPPTAFPCPPPPPAATPPTQEPRKASVTDNNAGTNKSEAKPAVSWKSPSSSVCSDTSGASRQSFSFPILAEGVTTESLKPEASKTGQKSLVAATETPSISASRRWFCCFPPCSWCCAHRSNSCSCF